MAALTVPVPQPSWEPAGPSPQIERPVQVGLPALTYPDGATATQEQLGKLGAFVYRTADGGGEALWNDAQQAWQPATTDLAELAALTPLALAARPGEALPWQGLLVAAGQKDQAGAPRYATATAGQPAYRLRAYARFTRDGTVHEGLSGPTADFTFVSGAESQRFSIGFDTGSASDCTVATLRLRGPALVAAGFLELRANGRELELASCDAGGAVVARVVLKGDGDIVLVPATGRRVVVDGDLEAGRVTYQPGGGGVKQTL